MKFPAYPTCPACPASRAYTVSQASPASSAGPASPACPAAQPAQQTQPAQPAQPAQPTQLAQPHQSVKPLKPIRPAQKALPSYHISQATPARQISSIPARPEAHLCVASAASPASAVSPASSAKVSPATQPGQRAHPGQLAHTAQTAQTAQPAQTKRSAKPCAATRLTAVHTDRWSPAHLCNTTPSQQRTVAGLDGQSVLRICLLEGLQLAALASGGKTSEQPQVHKSGFAGWWEPVHQHLSAGRPSARRISSDLNRRRAES